MKLLLCLNRYCLEFLKMFSMKRYVFVLVSSLLLLSSCTHDEKETKGFTYLAASVFKVRDKDKQDLLNPKTKGFYEHNQIRVLHLRNDGQYIMFDHPELDLRFDYDIFQNEGDYLFRLHGQVGDSFYINNKVTSVIKWNNAVSDTIVRLVNKQKYSWTTVKVWVNGELRYDMDDSTKNNAKVSIDR